MFSRGRKNDIQFNPKKDTGTADHVEQMRKGDSNIMVLIFYQSLTCKQVAIRLRPLNQKEADESEFETVSIIDQKVVVLVDPAYQQNKNDVLRENRNREKQYAFDYAFDKNSTQLKIYEKTTKFLIDGVLSGYNATVFAYGATGAGKTYTMMGTAGNPGNMFLTVQELFNQVTDESSGKDYVVKISYLEIYNEQIRDLLTSDNSNLYLRHDPIKGVSVTGISEVITSNVEEVFTMLKIGNKNRITEATNANLISSRSHAILRIVVSNKGKGKNKTGYVGKLSLIDLAGSERASKTLNRGHRLFEGAQINKSLLSLGNCINALARGKTMHIPYRDSKLTRLLKDSLGGNCRTVMIANISPATKCFEDTHNTLIYANRAKNIKTTVNRNSLNAEDHIERYNKIIKNLKLENNRLKRQLQQKGRDMTPRDIGSNQEIEKFKLDIQCHFEDEFENRKKLYQIEDKIEMLGFQLFKAESNLMMSKANSSKHKNATKQVDLFQGQMTSLMNQRNEIEVQDQFLIKKRGIMQRQIKDAQLNTQDSVYLESLLKQNLLALDNNQLERKEKRANMHLQQKEMKIEILENQLQIRDKILSDQTAQFRKNKLKPKIPTFSNLKEIQEQAVISFPKIRQKSVTKAYKMKVLEDYGLPKRKKMINYPSRRREDFDAFKLQENGGLNINPVRGNTQVTAMPKKPLTLKQKVSYVPKNPQSLHIKNRKKFGNFIPRNKRQYQAKSYQIYQKQLKGRSNQKLKKRKIKRYKQQSQRNQSTKNQFYDNSKGQNLSFRSANKIQKFIGLNQRKPKNYYKFQTSIEERPYVMAFKNDSKRVIKLGSNQNRGNSLNKGIQRLQAQKKSFNANLNRNLNRMQKM